MIPVRPKVALIVKAVLATLFLQFIIVVVALVYDDLVLSPPRLAKYMREQQAETKQWQNFAAQVNSQLGTKLNSDEVRELHYFLTKEQNSNFELINRVYTSKAVDHKTLFKTLRGLEVKK